jgi:hypothetical protein
MVDFTSTQAQSKELALPVRQGEAQAEAGGAKSPSAPPPLIANGADKMYHQLVEIHAIATRQLTECARWHRTDSTPRSVRAGMRRQRPGAVPSATRLAPSPSTDFASQALLWPRQEQHDEPQARCQHLLGRPSALPSRYEQTPW